jgi:hypothetical protein
LIDLINLRLRQIERVRLDLSVGGVEIFGLTGNGRRRRFSAVRDLAYRGLDTSFGQHGFELKRDVLGHSPGAVRAQSGAISQVHGSRFAFDATE